MGADMCVAVARWPYAEGEKTLRSGMGLERVMVNRLNNLDRGRLESVAWYFGYAENDEDDEGVGELMDRARVAITIHFGGDDLARDVCLLRLPAGPNNEYNALWLITGGLTWGDDPTDSYQEINMLSELGISDQALTDDELKIVREEEAKSDG